METCLRSFQKTPDNRRSIYLKLVSSIEGQLRDLYAQRHEEAGENQASVAKKLGVSRSVINRRLTGATNMTIHTLAEMIWALEGCIDVDIVPAETLTANKHRIVPQHGSREWTAPFGNALTASSPTANPTAGGVVTQAAP